MSSLRGRADDPKEEQPSDEPLSATERKAYEWRQDEFLRLGFADFTAELLASDPRVSLDQARRLIASGCPLDLALQILS